MELAAFAYCAMKCAMKVARHISLHLRLTLSLNVRAVISCQAVIDISALMNAGL
jgi:hypothetical protein